MIKLRIEKDELNVMGHILLHEFANRGAFLDIKPMLHRVSASSFLNVLYHVIYLKSDRNADCALKLIRSVEIDENSVFGYYDVEVFWRSLAKHEPSDALKQIAKEIYAKLPMQKLYSQVWANFFARNALDWLKFWAFEMRMPLVFCADCRNRIKHFLHPKCIRVLVDAGLDVTDFENNSTIREIITERYERARSTALCFWWCWKFRYGKDVGTIIAKLVWQSRAERCWDEKNEDSKRKRKKIKE